MDNKLRQEKLKMWKNNLRQLEEELKVILEKKSQAAEQGDLSEDVETTRVRIEETKKIIRDIEKGEK